MTEQRPLLREVPLEQVIPPRPGALIVTMSRGQWDVFLQASYDQGAQLLELDDNESPLTAYQKEKPND